MRKALKGLKGNSNFDLFLVNLSSAGLVGDIKYFNRKRKDRKIRIGVSVPYLCFNSEEIAWNDPNLKNYLPFRSRKNQENLIAFLLQGDISLLTSGH